LLLHDRDKELQIQNRTRIIKLLVAVAESGYPGFSASEWIAAFAGGTPEPVLERWNTEFTAALSAPEVQKVLLAAGLQAAPTSRADAQKFHREEVVKWGEVIKAADIKVQ
jgi:tripartite-type tricarboxylate transporter receptor subunit TctC